MIKSRVVQLHIAFVKILKVQSVFLEVPDFEVRVDEDDNTEMARLREVDDINGGMKGKQKG